MKGFKAVSIVLAAILLFSFGFGSLSVFADNVLSTLTIIDLNEPVAGFYPDYEWGTAEFGHFTCLQPGISAVWSESEDGEGYFPVEGTFKEGYYYSFSTSFEADPGYVWDGESIKNMIGSTADIWTEVYGSTLVLHLDYGPLPKAQIWSIGIEDVQVPVIGETIVSTYTISSFTHCVPSFKPGLGIWFVSDDGGVTFEPVQFNDVFKANCVYRFTCEVSPDEGYHFEKPLWASVNLMDANCGISYYEGREIATVSYVFGKLGEGVQIRPADGSDCFSTYHVNTPTEAEVEVINMPKNSVVSWYICDFMGTLLIDEPFATGTTATLPPITDDTVMVKNYILVIVTDLNHPKGGAAAIIPYMLFPYGIEYPDEPGYWSDGDVCYAGSYVDIFISLIANPGVSMLNFSVTFDNSYLTLTGVQCSNEAAAINFSNDYSSPFSVRWYDPTNALTEESELALVKLTFFVSANAAPGDYEINIDNIEAKNTSGDNVEVTSRTAMITVMEPLPLYGDVDGDGEITDWDAITLERYLAGWEAGIDETLSDVDGDGEITDWDAITLERYLAGWNVVLGYVW